MSGLSNVKYWLKSHGYDADDERCCNVLFAAAKSTDHTLTEDEITALLGGD